MNRVDGAGRGWRWFARRSRIVVICSVALLVAGLALGSIYGGSFGDGTNAAAQCDAGSNAPFAGYGSAPAQTACQPAFTGGPAEGSTAPETTVTFTWVPAGRYKCTLDSGASERCYGGTKTYSGLSQGRHTFTVGATYPNAPRATRTWTVGTPTTPTTPTVISQAQATDVFNGVRSSKAGRIRPNSHGVLVIPGTTFTCPANAATCTVTVSGTGVPGNGKLVTSAKKKRKRISLGRTKSKVGAGKKGRAKLKLSKKALKTLKRRKSLKATISVAVTNTVGQSLGKRKVTATIKPRKR